MSNIHFILQGKGGVGKSLISALLMQYNQENNIPTIAVDTDPVNASLAAYSAFPTKRIELLDEHRNMQPQKFDGLMDMIFLNDDKDFIIDNGASSFIPLSSYLVENEVMTMLDSMKRRVIVHTVITGGQAMKDTLHGLNALAANMNVPIVVWVNHYFGDVLSDGKSFEKMKVYQNNKDKVIAIINIEKMPPLFENDFEKMLENHLTFAQAEKDKSLGIMPRNRLKMIKKNIFSQLVHLNNTLNIINEQAEDSDVK